MLAFARRKLHNVTYKLSQRFNCNKAIIIGGGPGGCITALALQRKGQKSKKSKSQNGKMVTLTI